MINRQTLFQECYLLFPKLCYVLDKIKVRKIFEGQVEFDQQEMEILKQFETYLISKRFMPKFSPNQFRWTESQLLRMLYATKFKFEKTYAAIQAYIQWKNQAFPLKENQDTSKFLLSGSIYLHGRDNRFRPIIVVNAVKLAAQKNIDITLDSMTIFLEHVLSNYMLPGQIENWVVVMDLGGLGITSLPRQQLQRVLDYLQNNYRSRMHKCYVINCPSTITFSWNIVKGFLEEITVRKISFEKSSIPTGLFEHCHKSQVEQKYGGVSSNIENTFWPPKEISQQYFLPTDNISDILISKQQYNHLYEVGKLSKNHICKELLEDLGSASYNTNMDQNIDKKMKEEVPDPEEEQQVINNLIQNNQGFYQTEVEEKFDAVFWEATIQKPLSFNIHKNMLKY
ncbi:unnamed protein product (macronuclear) [Paramecium tetraurelia]|uniref:CRAL-TRIO domain-containing protein n=1 Tax=Paramecium tetraurelia TaxID=5888 RepID=A0E0W3_PARTE|nr:uncharacterized protein GSPATT00022098001 [Paramecium tetraurelia]CAK88930.1 unnamed protein product [Paramecium tetraurelia]|eukprot:XP_001456327.1 hypothetical protein (macronuclear) [Paramecium tetraurelia strain d4-2]